MVWARQLTSVVMKENKQTKGTAYPYKREMKTKDIIEFCPVVISGTSEGS